MHHDAFLLQSSYFSVSQFVLNFSLLQITLLDFWKTNSMRMLNAKDQATQFFITKVHASWRKQIEREGIVLL